MFTPVAFSLFSYNLHFAFYKLWYIGKKNPIMIIRAILAMSFLILQCCCARSSPSGFCHFQPESARETCVRLHGRSPPTRTENPRPPTWKSVALVQKICVIPHNYPQVSRAEQPRNLVMTLTYGTWQKLLMLICRIQHGYLHIAQQQMARQLSGVTPLNNIYARANGTICNCM